MTPAVEPSRREQLAGRLRQRLARNIQIARVHRELTQEKLAELAGLASRHVQKIEAGEVNLTLQSLAVLADVLGIEPAELIAKTDALKAVLRSTT